MGRERIKQVLKEELRVLEPVSAWKNDDGTYQLFGNYQLFQENSGYKVRTKNMTEVDFCSRRAAVAWCIADQHKDRNLAFEVRTLDSKLSRMTSDITSRRSIKGDLAYNQNVNIKLEHKLSRRAQIENDLERCVRLAKRYQRGMIQ